MPELLQALFIISLLFSSGSMNRHNMWFLYTENYYLMKESRMLYRKREHFSYNKRNFDV